MKLVHVILPILILIPTSTFSADASGNHAIWGIGNKSCITYTDARNSNDYSAYKYYLMGFLTAYNTFTPDTYRISGNMDLNEILAWLDDYCELKAVNAFELALTDFVFEHHEKRKKSSSSAFGR